MRKRIIVHEFGETNVYRLDERARSVPRNRITDGSVTAGARGRTATRSHSVPRNGTGGARALSETNSDRRLRTATNNPSNIPRIRSGVYRELVALTNSSTAWNPGPAVLTRGPVATYTRGHLAGSAQAISSAKPKSTQQATNLPKQVEIRIEKLSDAKIKSINDELLFQKSIRELTNGMAAMNC